jgi:ankyrin repeat protein
LGRGYIPAETRDKNGNSLLSLACWYNHYEIGKFLIETHAANVDSRDLKMWTPLAIAAFHGNFKMVVLLLDHKADPMIINDHHRVIRRDNFARLQKS